MFEKAVRLKLRFDTPVGKLSIEDLWELPLTSRQYTNLDDLARSLHRQLKNDDDVSFVDDERKSDVTTQLKFDIVKHIIDVRLVERTAAVEAEKNREKKQKLLSILAEREDDTLRSLSVEELRELVNSL